MPRWRRNGCRKAEFTRVKPWWLASCLLLAGCASSSSYSWGWYIVSPLNERGLRNARFLLDGLTATLSVSLAAITISMIAGMALALAAMSGQRWLRAAYRVYVELIRALPVLVLLLWVYYGLPVVFGIEFGVFTAGVITLALSDSAFEAEVFRGGIQSVPIGQKQAAQALGLTPWQTMWLVVLPQAIRRILPALGNQFVYVVKMSSLISVIGLQDLTRRANELNLTEFRPLEVYTFLIGEYLMLILVISALVRWMERRLTTP